MNETKHGGRQGGQTNTNDMHVFARIRPVEKFNGDNRRNFFEVHRNSRGVTISEGQNRYDFLFEECFNADSSQVDVYESAALPLVDKFISGKNCCVVTYGEESAGKTYSLIGNLPSLNGDDQNIHELDENDDVSSIGSHGASEIVPQLHLPPTMNHPPLQVRISNQDFQRNLDHPDAAQSYLHNNLKDKRNRRNSCGFPYIPLKNDSGIIPRFINSVYSALNKGHNSTVPTPESDPVIIIHCSYIMIYLEKVVDLLSFSGECSNEQKEKLTFLRLKESRSKGGVYVDGVTERHCPTEAHVYELLHQGMQNRKHIEAKFKADLSRSHSIFTIKLEIYRKSSKSKVMSRMNFCEWANSGAQNRESSKSSSMEAKMNLAHVTIQKVVDALNADRTNNGKDLSPPYANSKVTYFLKDSFGGNCVTSFILNVFPMNTKETLATFRLGSGLRTISNRSGVSIFKGSVPIKYQEYYANTSNNSNGIHTISEGSNDISSCSNEEKSKKHHLPPSMTSVTDTRVTEPMTESSIRTQRSAKGSNLDSSKEFSASGSASKYHNSGGSGSSKPLYEASRSALPLKSKPESDNNQALPSRTLKTGTPTKNITLKSDSNHVAIEEEKKSFDHSGECTHNQNQSQRNNTSQNNNFSLTDFTSEAGSYRELTMAENMLRHGASSKTGITISSLESVRGAAKHMEEDLAAARNELTTVYALLKASAKRMEEELTIAQDLVCHRSTERCKLHRSESAEKIENDLIAARKELDIFQSKRSEHVESMARPIGQRFEFFKNRTQHNSGKVEKDLDSVITETILNLDSSNLSDIEKQLVALKLENERLMQSNAKQDKELQNARKDLKTLSLRKTENETIMGQLFNMNESTKEQGLATGLTHGTRSRLITENLAVSNVVDSPLNVTGTFPEIFEKIPTLGSENDYLEKESSIQVYLRLRPMSKLETSRRSRSCIELLEGNQDFFVDSPLDGEYDFSYDKTFDTNVSQSDIYDFLGKNIVDNLLCGINHCLIGCGLTSSGKTYTLVGTLPESNKDDALFGTLPTENDAVKFDENSDVGLTPRVVCDLYKKMFKSSSNIQFNVRCSFVAIYHEKIFDLLEPQREKILSVKENDKGVDIDGASEAFCYDESDVFALIQRGEACQSVLSTRMNIDSNRTHSVFCMHIEKKNLSTGLITSSRLQIADLAGFEIGAKNKGQSMLDSKIVHRSFTALGNVVKALADKNNLAPYRESKLTCVLKDALGGNCKTIMFVTASPSSYNISETINAIRLGQRVRRLVNTPKINYDISKEQYKKWCLASEVKFCDLKAFVKDLSQEISKTRSRDNLSTDTEESPLNLSSEHWKSIKSMLEDKETVENPCAYFLEAGKLDDMKKCSLKWRILSTALAKKAPSENIADAISAREKAEAQLYDIQTEASVLRRLNEILVSDKKNNEERMSFLKKDLKLQALKISELEHKLKMSEYREKKTVMFLKHLRKICWRLQKDVSTNRSIDISEITSCISGSPDLSGLVDLDYLLLETGLMDQRELLFNDDDEEYEKLLELTEQPDGPLPGNGEYYPAEYENHISDEQNDCPSNSNLQPGRWLKNMSQFAAENWKRKGEEIPLEYKHLLENDLERRSRKEKQLDCDLRNMTNKCIELQMLLNEEKANVDVLTNRSGSLTKKRLAQEAIALRKERDRMEHNAKAATWKLQELHVVNKVLAKKSAETVQHVTFLEEGFKKLQETFRTTVLDSLDSDTTLRDRLAHFECVVESLTVPQTRAIEYDELSRPVHRMNLPIRGQAIMKGDFHDSAYLETVKFNRYCLSLNKPVKRHEFMPCSKVRRKSKFRRRSKKMKESAGGVKVKELKSRFKKKHVPIRTFEGNLYFFSYLGRR